MPNSGELIKSIDISVYPKEKHAAVKKGRH